jgi:biotin carboxyl carrier protein
MEVVMKYEVSVNGREGQLRVDDSQFEYRGVARDYSMAQSGPGIYSVLMNGRSYQATMLSPGVIQVEGRLYSVDVFDPRELRARSSTGSQEGRQNIAAQMPGKVVRVLVAKGDAVKKGQGLIVVEAMKMQNELKSPKAGVVAEVKAADGATVAAGEILVVIE